MTLIKAVHTASAHYQRTDRESRPHIQAACSLRAKQCLVTGKAQHVNVQCLHIYRLSPGCLGSIHDQKQAVPVCKLRDPGKVSAIARHIGSTCNNDRLCIGTDQPLPAVILQTSFLVHPGKTELNPLLIPQTVERPQNGVVLANSRDDVVSRREQSAQRRIQRLSGIGRKRDAGWVRCVQKP